MPHCLKIKVLKNIMQQPTIMHKILDPSTEGIESEVENFNVTMTASTNRIDVVVVLKKNVDETATYLRNNLGYAGLVQSVDDAQVYSACEITLIKLHEIIEAFHCIDISDFSDDQKQSLTMGFKEYETLRRELDEIHYNARVDRGNYANPAAARQKAKDHYEVRHLYLAAEARWKEHQKIIVANIKQRSHLHSLIERASKEFINNDVILKFANEKDADFIQKYCFSELGYSPMIFESQVKLNENAFWCIRLSSNQLDSLYNGRETYEEISEQEAKKLSLSLSKNQTFSMWVQSREEIEYKMKKRQQDIQNGQREPEFKVKK